MRPMSRAEQIDMIPPHRGGLEAPRPAARHIVKRRHDLGGDVSLAEDLLEEFEVTLAEHQRHLDRIMGEQG
jgi:hypothetical protein